MDRLTYRDGTGRARLTRYGMQIYCSTQATADCFAKLEESIPQWVSANEKKPHAECGEGDTVFTVNKLGVMHLLYWDGSNWCEPTGECYDSQFKVTHWIPLPEPPKEGGGEDADK